MKNFIKLAFISFLSTSAYGAVVVPTGALMCTRDYNLWGEASRCACPSETDYDLRIGRCIQGSFDPVSTMGEISSQVSAIGGETTGVVIQASAEESYELVLPNYLKEQLNQGELKGIQYEVEGDYLIVPGVETGDRPTIIVNSLKPINQGQ